MKKQLIFGSLVALTNVINAQFNGGALPSSSIYRDGKTGFGMTTVPGTANPVEIQTTAAESGLIITQKTTASNAGAAALHLKNNSTGGYQWSLFSLGSGNSAWGTGNFAVAASPDNGLTYNNWLSINKTTGNVGVSTIFPAAKLHVTGDQKISALVAGNSAFEIGITGQAATISKFKVFGDGRTFIGNFTSPTNDYVANGSILTIGQTVKADKAFNIIDNTSATLPIDIFAVYGSGEVNLNEPLGLNTGDKSKGLTIACPSGINTDYLKIFDRRNTAGNSWQTNELRIQKSVDVTDMHYVSFKGSYGYSSLNFGFGNTDLMSILENGHVNIGTPLGNTNANYSSAMLSVQGKIVAQEIIVTTNWADYVFANNYKLNSLNYVENYIKENKHLPNVPSAKEVEKNGVSVGEMSKIQMEKIEELTLYVIELKKEIEVIKKRIK